MIYEMQKTSIDTLKLIATDARLKGNEYRIYEFLVSKANNATGECFWNIGNIATKTGVHTDTVRRVIKRLVAKGYVLVQHRKNSYNNENTSNIYTICEMLTPSALNIKKAYIEQYPTIKKDVDVVEDLIANVIEKLVGAIEEEVVGTEEVTAVEEPVVEEVVETPYEKMMRESREMMISEQDQKDDMLIKSAMRFHSVALTKDQARSLNSHYTLGSIESALEKSSITGNTTYAFVHKTLIEMEEQRVAILELRNPLANIC